jgi:hypothetical protein
MTTNAQHEDDDIRDGAGSLPAEVAGAVERLVDAADRASGSGRHGGRRSTTAPTSAR